MTKSDIKYLANDQSMRILTVLYSEFCKSKINYTNSIFINPVEVYNFYSFMEWLKLKQKNEK